MKRKRVIDEREREDPIADLDPTQYDGNFKRKSTDPKDRKQDGACQAGAYALELLSCTYGSRMSCLSAILDDDIMSFWCYKPTGILYTTQYVSLVRDFETAAAIIIAFARCTPEEFGVFPRNIIKPPNLRSTKLPLPNLSGSHLSLKHPTSDQQICVTLGDHVFTQYSLTGRRTFVYKADTTPSVTSERLIIKFSFQVTTRTPEHELVSLARDAGVGHLPEVHLWQDLWEVEDVARSVYRLRCRNAEKGVGTATKPEEPDCEDRKFRAIVYTEYYPLRMLLPRHPELIPVMVDQILDCEPPHALGYYLEYLSDVMT